jgi:hypothetical protein
LQSLLCHKLQSYSVRQLQRARAQDAPATTRSLVESILLVSVALVSVANFRFRALGVVFRAIGGCEVGLALIGSLSW